MLLHQAGLARFPTSAHMVLVYINFLANVQKNMQACNSQLQAARKLDANWCDRCGGLGLLLFVLRMDNLSIGTSTAQHIHRTHYRRH